jgi:hypothetical protein
MNDINFIAFVYDNFPERATLTREIIISLSDKIDITHPSLYNLYISWYIVFYPILVPLSSA